MRKRGVIEIQFNWIFVLVVGAMIIIMFMSFISKQQGIHELSTSIFAANSLGSIFFGYGNKDISTVVGIPESKIDFNCDSFSINGVSKQLGTLNFFSPSHLETNKLNLLSLGLGLPYRVANFIYITSPDVRYIFIGNSDFARKVFEKVRGKINVDGFTSMQAIEDENDAAVRIIFFGQEPEVPEDLRDAENPITSLRVDGDEDNGTVEFFDFSDGKFEPRGKSNYIREASLFGAVFSDDIERYNCVMEKGFNKLRIISQIYKERTNNITQQYIIDGKNQLCADFYQNNLLSISNSLFTLQSFDTQSYDYEDIINATNYIKKINKEADNLSCALIY